MTTGQSVLVKDQATATQNGIYTVTEQGSASAAFVLTRRSDSDNNIAGQVKAGDAVYTLSGSVNTAQGFVLTTVGTGTDGAIVFGTDSLSFSQFTGTSAITAGDGLSVNLNTINVGTASNTRIVINADTIDLASVNQTNTAGSHTTTFLSDISIDGYGRVTGHEKSIVSFSGYAPLANAALTGTPTAPTAANGTSTTQIATTQFVAYATSPIQNTLDNISNTYISKNDFNAKGDLLVASADNTSSVLSVGTNGYYLKANSSASSGLEWASIPTINALDDVGDVTITSAASGQFLKWNGTAWVNDAIDLATDTTGNYVSGISAGAGISVTHTPGEGSTATIALDAVLAGSVLLGNASNVATATALTGDVTVNSSGVTAIAANAVVDGDVSPSAGIQLSKLESVLSGRVIIGNASNVATAVTLSGDITVDSSGVVSIAANSVALGTDTTGNYMSGVTAGTGVTVSHTPGEGSTATISIGQAVGTGSSVTFASVGTTGDANVGGNLIVSGNLTVSGTTTSVNTETLTIDDNIIVLNNNEAGTPSQNAGLEVERGTSTNVLLRWNETNDKWELTNDGTTYGNVVTTADSGTVTSTMIADGTIVNADINASAAIAHSKLANATAGQVLLGTTTTGVVTATTVSGDVTIDGAGVTAIGAGVIVNADVSASANIALSKLATGTSGQVPVANATGVLTYVTPSGDVTWTDTGNVQIAAGAIVNADISSSAAIDLGKIADVTIDAKAASYTLVLTDKNKVIEVSNASATTLTVPADNSVNFPVGSQITVLQTGAGQVTIAGAAGVTVNATPGLKLRTQWASATLMKRAANTWVALGDLAV